ncbi:MAG: hypothetical protein OCD01_02250 [Fibrobacterales bacterium]
MCRSGIISYSCAILLLLLVSGCTVNLSKEEIAAPEFPESACLKYEKNIGEYDDKPIEYVVALNENNTFDEILFVRDDEVLSPLVWSKGDWEHDKWSIVLIDSDRKISSNSDIDDDDDLEYLEKQLKILRENRVLQITRSYMSMGDEVIYFKDFDRVSTYDDTANSRVCLLLKGAL